MGILGPFQLVRHLADGGMGSVWLARDPLGEAVAIKLLRARASDAERLAWSLENEIRAVAALDHPNIAAVLDVGRVSAEAAARAGLTEGAPWFAMEYAPGGTLQGLMGQRLGFEELREVALTLLDALGHAHARGVIHRDLKPANVLLGEGASLPQRLRLADFGVAFGIAPEEAEDAPIVGTPAYMAPEQRVGRWRDLGPWTDLYALGVLVCDQIWGARASRDAADPRALLTRALPSGLPPGLSDWLAWLLEPEPERRAGRAADAAAELRSLLAPGGTEGGHAWAPISTEPTRPLQRSFTALPTLSRWDQTMPVDPAQLASPDPGPLPGGASRPPPPCPPDWRDDRRAHARAGRPALIGLRSLPMVGREPDRDALWAAFAGVAQTGRPAAVALRGPAGAGKSRLAAWLAERAHEVGAAEVLVARHSAEQGPQEGLAAMVGRAIRGQGLAPDELRVRLRRAAAWDPGAQDDTIEALALMLQCSNSRSAPTRQQDRLDVLLAALRWLRRGRVAVVWLDDVQWSEEAIALARAALLAADVAPLPALFVLTAAEEALAERPIEAAALARLADLPAARALPVAPLPPEDGLALVRALLPLTPGLARLVADRAAGNPLFTVQVLGDWAQRGLVIERETGFALHPTLELELPRDLAGAWAARVAHLLEGRPPAEARALAAAAALGVEVDADEWRALCEALGVPPSAELVRRLVARRLARQEAGQPGWSFAHPLLREAVLLDAGPALGEIHRAAASTLLARPAEPLRAERVARHLWLAGEVEAALPYLAAATEVRFRRGEAALVEHLVEWTDRALDALGVPPEHPRRVPGWLLRGQAIAQTRSLDVSRAWYERVEAVAAAHGPPRELLRARELRATGLLAQGDAEAALALADATVALAIELGETTELPWAQQAAAACHLMAGRLRQARAGMEAALAGFEAQGALDGQARSHRELAQCCHSLGDLDGAARHLDAYEALCERLGNLSGRMSALILRGEVLRAAGDLEGAGARYAEALVRFEAIGSRSTAITGANLALVRIAQGRYAEARALAEAAVRRARQSRHQTVELCARVTLLVPLAAEGDRPALLEQIEQVEAMTARVRVAHHDLRDALAAAVAAVEPWGWHELQARLTALRDTYAARLGAHAAAAG